MWERICKCVTWMILSASHMTDNLPAGESYLLHVGVPHRRDHVRLPAETLRVRNDRNTWIYRTLYTSLRRSAVWKYFKVPPRNRDFALFCSAWNVTSPSERSVMASHPPSAGHAAPQLRLLCQVRRRGPVSAPKQSHLDQPAGADQGVWSGAVLRRTGSGSGEGRKVRLSFCWQWETAFLFHLFVHALLIPVRESWGGQEGPARTPRRVPVGPQWGLQVNSDSLPRWNVFRVRFPGVRRIWTEPHFPCTWADEFRDLL